MMISLRSSCFTSAVTTTQTVASLQRWPSMAFQLSPIAKAAVSHRYIVVCMAGLIAVWMQQGCIPCVEPCTTEGCVLPCAAPCVHLPSSARCTLLLECGHRCPCLASEKCPSRKFCQTCGPSEVLDLVRAWSSCSLASCTWAVQPSLSCTECPLWAMRGHGMLQGRCWRS